MNIRGITMRHAALALFIGSAAAQGVTSAIAPAGTPPAGAQSSVDGPFQISVVDAAAAGKRDVQKRPSCSTDGVLVAALADSVMTDSKRRTGYIASNYQFQFDGPPQAGALYTAGFYVAQNKSLVLGGSATFYKCLSGDFYNLYDRSWAAQCLPVEIIVMPCTSNFADSGSNAQAVGTQIITTTEVVPLSDGQPQVITTTLPIPLCQITDGQLQVHTTPCAAVSTSASTADAPVSQYLDGQIQITGAATTTAAIPSASLVILPSESLPASSRTGGNSSLMITAGSRTSSGTIPIAISSSSVAVSTTSAPPTSGAARIGASVFALAASIVTLLVL